MAIASVTLSTLMVVEWREGDVVRRLRMAAGWKLWELSAACGVNLQVIHKIETGETKEAKRATLKKIASAFGLTDRHVLDAVPPPMDLPIHFAKNEARAPGKDGGRDQLRVGRRTRAM